MREKTGFGRLLARLKGGRKPRITGQIRIGELLEAYPEALETLTQCGMHCLGCPSSQAESLEQACLVHGLNAEAVVELLQERLGQSAQD